MLLFWFEPAEEVLSMLAAFLGMIYVFLEYIVLSLKDLFFCNWRFFFSAFKVFGSSYFLLSMYSFFWLVSCVLSSDLFGLALLAGVFSFYFKLVGWGIFYFFGSKIEDSLFEIYLWNGVLLFCWCNSFKSILLFSILVILSLIGSWNSEGIWHSFRIWLTQLKNNKFGLSWRKKLMQNSRKALKLNESPSTMPKILASMKYAQI